MKCFYHSADLDGHCSGALIKIEFPECEMFPIDYGQEFPFENIQPGELVFMVDFSLQPFIKMIHLSEICELIWIDHHKTAIEEANKYNCRINGVQEVGRGACALVYNFLHKDKGLALPYPVSLLSQYDVWDLSDKNTLPFQMGMRVEEHTDPKNSESIIFWKELIREETAYRENRILNDFLTKGEAILKYQRNECNKMFCQRSYLTEFEGLKARIINGGIANSMAFEIDDDPNCSLGIMFWRRPDKRWNVHLYSQKVDVGFIAKKHGGGGHEGAAGFQCDELPFEI